MPRITPEERERMHKYLDICIDKMDSPKNSKKRHWSEESIFSLRKMAEIEVHELELAMMPESMMPSSQVLDECKDVVNITMMIIDNLFARAGWEL